MTSALENIFTSKVVGGLFAVAFASWAFVLQSLGNQWLEEQKEVRVEIAALKTQMAEHRLYAAETGTKFAERQETLIEWVKNHEAHHLRDDAWKGIK